MQTITIQALKLKNFKGCENLELVLNGKNAGIYGDNATGKTTVYDALTWLLFGKDSRGSADQELMKPLTQDGSVRNHEALTSVEAVLSVANEDNGGQIARAITLRKEMQEAWVTRRGSSQLVYDGNDFRYYVDDVPMKKNEFSRRVGELVDEDTFRVLTSVTAFAQDMPWRKRREILYDMSGAAELSDRALLQMAARSEADEKAGQRFEALADQMGSKSLDELRKVLLQRQKALKGMRDQTPARIDELTIQENKMAATDFDGAKAQLEAARQELSVLRAEIAMAEAEETDSSTSLRFAQNDGNGGADSSTSLRFAQNDRNGKPVLSAAELGLRELEIERAAYETEWLKARQEIEGRKNALDRENDAWLRENWNAIQDIKCEIRALEDQNLAFRKKQIDALPDLVTLQETADRLAERVQGFLAWSREADEAAAKLEALVDRNRQEWLSANQAAFIGGSCPTCGQELPIKMLTEAKARFESDKASKLNDIQSRAEINRESAEKARAKAAEHREKAALIQMALDKALDDLQTAKKTPQTVLDMEGYQKQSAALGEKLAALEGQTKMPNYRDRLEPILAEMKDREAVREMPGYEDRLAALQAELVKEETAAAREADEKAHRRAKTREHIEALRAKERSACAEEQTALDVLGQMTVLDYTRKRIQDLRDAQKAAGAELEQVDAALYAIEAFIRWKTHYVEDSINGLFRIVTFRLFREQANGGLEERCDVVVDGVPYNALNNGTRINAGLDIIRRLAEHFGVRVPLFVDNAEGVTRLEDAGTQVIRLVVSEKDQSLRVETE